jgi:hypothetical protein
LATSGPIVPSLDDDDDDDDKSVGGIKLARKPKYPEKPSPNAPLFTINPT